MGKTINSEGFPTPLATVDAALFTLRNGVLCVVLCRRENEPYKGRLALPGGFVHVDEDADTAATARRVLRQKTGIAAPYLEQLYTFSGAVRDPRGWSISVAYYALVPEIAVQREGGAVFEIVPIDRLPELPFDHNRIINQALERLRSKSTYSSLPCFLLPEMFTIGDLHQMYQQVTGTRLDPASFRKKIEDQGIIEPVEGMKKVGAHRPAKLYRMRAEKLRQFERRI